MPFLLAHPEVLDAMTCNARGRLTRESILSVAAMSEGPLGGKAHSWLGMAAGMDGASTGAPSEGQGAFAGGSEGEGTPAVSVDVFPAAAPAAGRALEGRRPVLSAVEEGATMGTERGSAAGDEHTVVEFAAGSPEAPLQAEEEAERAAAFAAGTSTWRLADTFRADGGVEAGMHSFSASPTSIQLLVDARAGTALGSTWAPEDAAADGEQAAAGEVLLDPSAPVTRGQCLLTGGPSWLGRMCCC
jgi:hypothetical protein